MRAPRSLTNSLFTKVDQDGVKGLWRNTPDARPLHCASFFLRELDTLLLSRAIHAGQYTRIQVALIESGLAAANHRGHYSGNVLTLPMVHTASGYSIAMLRISRASFATAANASRRARAA